MVRMFQLVDDGDQPDTQALGLLAQRLHEAVLVLGEMLGLLMQKPILIMEHFASRFPIFTQGGTHLLPLAIHQLTLRAELFTKLVKLPQERGL